MATITNSVLVIPDHPSLSEPMREDVKRLLSLPLRHWRRWNCPVGEERLRSGNCHHAAAALIMDLVDASAAPGWRIGSGYIRVPNLREPALHSWLETPNGAVVDGSQVFILKTGFAASRAFWFEAFAVEPLIQRLPGQVAKAVRRFGLGTAAVLPLLKLLEAASTTVL